LAEWSTFEHFGLAVTTDACGSGGTGVDVGNDGGVKSTVQSGCESHLFGNFFPITNDVGILHWGVGLVWIVHEFMLKLGSDFAKYLTREEEVETCFLFNLFGSLCYAPACLFFGCFLHALTSRHIVLVIPAQTVLS